MVTDTCPSCLLRSVRPGQVRHGSKSVRYGYQCPRCRATWATDYVSSQYGIPNEREPELWSA